MTGHEDPLRTAAEVGNVGVNPGEGAGDVLDVLGMQHGRREPVVGQGRGDPLAGQELANAGVQSGAAVVPHRPGAAVDEQNDRVMRQAARQEQVEAVPAAVFPRAVVVGDVAHAHHRKRLAVRRRHRSIQPEFAKPARRQAEQGERDHKRAQPALPDGKPTRMES